MIRKMKKIKEMNINNKEVPLSQIADDTWLCLDGSEECLVGGFVFILEIIQVICMSGRCVPIGPCLS